MLSVQLFLKEREEKKKKEQEEKEQRKQERQQKKIEREREAARKAEERAKKAQERAEERARKEEEQAKRAAERARKAEEKAKKSEQQRSARSRRQVDVEGDRRQTKRRKIGEPSHSDCQVVQNVCCVCGGTFEEDQRDATGLEWVECACKRWLHEDCIVADIQVNADGREIFCPYCVV